ncbi:MAG: T9SS type A sorting domain-containing protein [Bacteroidales bacterium]|nr:T9SS type A sorting domain-containing protein [Bacteroidales bacterium]MDY5788845.1 T9SS type A sorting domain-containing protein [Candidatus Onthomorpha sp.]
MKNMIFRNVLIAVCLLIATNSAKSQIDTAWVTSEHSSQYIYPQLINSEYDPEMTFDNVVVTAIELSPMEVDNYKLWRIAQRYDVTDSVKLCGVSFASNSIPVAFGQRADTLTVGIMDSALYSTIYSKTFIVGGREDGNYIVYNYPDSAAHLYIEVMFDDTILLNDPYYVFFEYHSCRNGVRTDIKTVNVREYSRYVIQSQTCVPSGYAPKYRPYFMAEGDREWRDYNDILPNASPDEIEDLYAYVCSYPRVNNCDTIVLSPIGICPIRVLEENTSSSVLSVELLEKAVRLYPNPANEVLNLACDYDIATVAVFDVLNRLVEERKVNAKTLQLSLANYAQGTYFITITTPKGKLNKKFVVQ